MSLTAFGFMFFALGAIWPLQKVALFSQANSHTGSARAGVTHSALSIANLRLLPHAAMQMPVRSGARAVYLADRRSRRRHHRSGEFFRQADWPKEQCRTGADGRVACGYHCTVSARGEAVCARHPEAHCKIGADGRVACGFDCKTGADGKARCAKWPNGACKIGADGHVYCSE